MGLSSSVAPGFRPAPGSLENIFHELHLDLGLPRPSNGDLTPWAEQGVLLLGDRNLGPSLGDFPAIESSHPSPVSADRGFFGSRPVSRTNELLERRGAEPVDRRLP